jgi:DNA end-binding protein Ku
MAEQLISAMTGEFDPEQYHDEYRDALMKIIESKVEGREMTAPEPVAESTKLVDLMAALEASVKAAKDARESGGDKPVSVEDAKKARTARSAKAKAADADEDAKPARKRKSA